MIANEMKSKKKLKNLCSSNYLVEVKDYLEETAGPVLQWI